MKKLLLLIISIIYFLLLIILISYSNKKEIYKNQDRIEYKILRELKENK